MGATAPKPPTPAYIPPPMQPSPAAQITDEQKNAGSLAAGMQAGNTIKTGPGGLTIPASTTVNTLLGA